MPARNNAEHVSRLSHYIPVAMPRFAYGLFPQIVQKFNSAIGENRPVDNLQFSLMGCLPEVVGWIHSPNTLKLLPL